MLKYTADGCQEVAVPVSSGCCPPPLCGNDLCCTFVAFMNQLPSGPLWDFWKAKAIDLYRNPNPNPCPLDFECPSIILHAIYCVLKLKSLIHDGLWPAYREASPFTAVTQVDYWLDLVGWEDCYRQACRPQYHKLPTPYEIMSDCGPMFCDVPLPPELLAALKMNTLRALARAQMGVIKSLCGINWVIEPLHAVVTSATPQPPNPSPPLPDANQCQGYCPDGITFIISPVGDTMDGVPSGDVCDQQGSSPIQAWYDWGCWDQKPMGLPDIIWPGVLAAECIVRSMMPLKCPPLTLIRSC